MVIAEVTSTSTARFCSYHAIHVSSAASFLFEPPFPVFTNEIVEQLKAVDAHAGGVFTKLGLDAAALTWLRGSNETDRRTPLTTAKSAPNQRNRQQTGSTTGHARRSNSE